jgi:rRNA small subunit pseudouridine methyltransferase Nep1
MLNLIFFDTALELVPFSMLNHPSVRRNAKRRNKKPAETLLDRSLHHYGMTRIENAERRGRPDIIHFCLLEALGSPLNKENRLKIWVNTNHGYTIEVDPETRLPRDYNRFKGLMESLFINGQVPQNIGAPLMSIRKMSIEKLLQKVKPSKLYLLSSHGEPSSLDNLVSKMVSNENPCALVGAYPSGQVSSDIHKLADEVISVYGETLEAWVITSRLIYEYEKQFHP